MLCSRQKRRSQSALSCKVWLLADRIQTKQHSNLLMAEVRGAQRITRSKFKLTPITDGSRVNRLREDLKKAKSSKIMQIHTKGLMDLHRRLLEEETGKRTTSIQDKAIIGQGMSKNIRERKGENKERSPTSKQMNKMAPQMNLPLLKIMVEAKERSTKITTNIAKGMMMVTGKMLVGAKEEITIIMMIEGRMKKNLRNL